MLDPVQHGIVAATVEKEPDSALREQHRTRLKAGLTQREAAKLTTDIMERFEALRRQLGGLHPSATTTTTAQHGTDQ